MSILDEFEDLEAQGLGSFIERRKKPDWAARGAAIAAVLGWVSAVFALVMLDRAGPASENFFTHYFGVTVISQWNTSMVRWAFAAIIVSVAASGLGLVLRALRKRRNTDRYPIPLIVVSGFSVILLVVFLVRYSVHL